MQHFVTNVEENRKYIQMINIIVWIAINVWDNKAENIEDKVE